MPETHEDEGPRLEPDLNPTFQTSVLEPRDSVLTTVLRAALIVLALVVAAGFILVLLPQRSVDRASEALRSRNSAVPAQEKIAFLYLGDEIKGKEFHIRGVVRNIMTTPLEKLDANVRLYSPDNRLLETRVVRMDVETIAPDAIAQFNLTFPDYAGQFGSYSVDFTLRDGEPVPYKDMRGSRGRD